jgi:hypothetical protein
VKHLLRSTTIQASAFPLYAIPVEICEMTDFIEAGYFTHQKSILYGVLTSTSDRILIFSIGDADQQRARCRCCLFAKPAEDPVSISG